MVGYEFGRFLCNDFPNTRGQRKINPLLRNVCNQNAYFSGNKYIDKPLLKKLPGQTKTELLEFPQQRYTPTNAASKTKKNLGEGVLSPVR
jgi:hypothetical protein